MTHYQHLHGTAETIHCITCLASEQKQYCEERIHCVTKKTPERYD